MTALFAFLIPFAIAMVITYNWVKGIDYMQKNHPDYKGEDFLGEDVDTK
jgi:hypothetical protein